MTFETASKSIFCDAVLKVNHSLLQWLRVGIRIDFETSGVSSIFGREIEVFGWEIEIDLGRRSC
jgi:hypothetical protein